MTSLRVAGLFAGIGGIESGLARAGHASELLCEWDASAQRILRERFLDVEVVGDVRDLNGLPEVDLVAAGFPCSDISQAGRKVGIEGEQSGLVSQIWRLLGSQKTQAEWLLLENVSYLLSLDKGNGMRHLVESVEALGYRWAYRVVDARSFGLPQRRQRVVFIASRTQDPTRVLFADDEPDVTFDDAVGAVDNDSAYGFYWTEGLRGLGWAKDAVPTVKGGSGLGIPSPPAIWLPWSGEFGTPHIEDGERLQGFESGWTEQPALNSEPDRRLEGARWKQVGNAVCVPMSTWVGERLADPGERVDGAWGTEWNGKRWPLAAYGESGKVWLAPVSTTPLARDFNLRKFLVMPLRPLSRRASSGFLTRAQRGKLRFPDGFLRDLEKHRDAQV